MTDLKLKLVVDWEGNRSTVATYKDDDGACRSTKLNGHVTALDIQVSVMNYRARTAPHPQ